MYVDRVALVALCWFVLWTAIGIAIGVLFGTPGTGAVSGFVFALLATLAWPWLMPDSINDWMDDLPA
jgi:hypothetical protein